MTRTVPPIATYRFQLTPDDGFDAVVERLDHVRRLGASHVYLSPIAEAVPGSTHGYDVVDHTRVRAELGGAAAFERLLEEAATRSMAVLFDHVPNHVAATRPDLNPAWWAVLRDGPGSAADEWFDIDWEAGDSRVILPVLGAPLEQAITEGAIARDGDALAVYGERRVPIASGTDADPPDLATLLSRQHYRLQHWREPTRNTRRFFTIDDLVAVRVERPHVADVVDTLPERYAGHAGFGGVRVDHVDGLADPLGYLRRLRARIGDDALLYVEKIVVPGEALPSSWPVDGTTGYEFARICDQVLLDATAEPVFDRRWHDDSGEGRPFHDWEHAARLEVVAEALAPDLARLVRDAARALGAEPGDIADEVTRLTIELPRYRTYLPDDPEAAELVTAISDGPVARAILDPSTPAEVGLRTRWQQLTGPVMAKGAEDRSFYRYLRLASLCEVGGDPATFGIPVDEFHTDNEHRAERWPRALLASSTHDTKRSEDVRAESAALTWRVGATTGATGDAWVGWEAWSRTRSDELAEHTGLDRVTISLGLQTLVTTPGIDVDRLEAYLVKAMREAARHTTWEQPDGDYERRLGVLAASLTEIDTGVLGLGAVAQGLSLAATVLRLTAPGVPDIYQGTEAFSHRLVDPDNRIPPDWAQLDAMVRDERSVADQWGDGSLGVKAAVVRDVLGLRRRRPAAFAPGSAYAPIDAGDGVVAYRRGGDVVVVVRRGLADVDRTFPFPDGAWHDVLDPGAPLMSGDVATASLVGSGADHTLPVAVLERA